MRTGKELILATRPYAQDVPAKSWWIILSTGTLLLLATAGALAPWLLPVRLVCSLISGLLILRFFVIYHDHQHRAILPGSKPADLLMRVFGVLALSPTSIWQSSHNYHHANNSRLRGSHIGSYPIMTKTQFAKASKADRFWYLFMRHPVTMLFGYVFVFLFGMCIYPFCNRPREHLDSLVALLVHLGLAIGVTVWLGWPALVLGLLVPHLIACALGSYLFYAQHNFPTATFKDRAGWTYEGAALESSSFMQLNPVMSWFTANIGYHHLHHLNARIPFYRLPEAMRGLPELQQPKVTSLAPREIVRCLRLKVWDVDAQRLVPVTP